ncbi:MAG: hypothetical protein ABSE90_08605 [Verrucomicrobiota bacterium]
MSEDAARGRELDQGYGACHPLCSRLRQISGWNLCSTCRVRKRLISPKPKSFLPIAGLAAMQQGHFPPGKQPFRKEQAFERAA